VKISSIPSFMVGQIPCVRSNNFATLFFDSLIWIRWRKKSPCCLKRKTEVFGIVANANKTWEKISLCRCQPVVEPTKSLIGAICVSGRDNSFVFIIFQSFSNISHCFFSQKFLIIICSRYFIQNYGFYHILIVLSKNPFIFELG